MPGLWRSLPRLHILMLLLASVVPAPSVRAEEPLPDGSAPATSTEAGPATAPAPEGAADAGTTATAETVRLPVAEAREFLGDWILKVTTFRGDNYVDFRASGEDGFVLATFTLPPPMTVEPIRTISRNGEEFIMKFILNFGSSVIDMTMSLRPEADRFVGTLVDANNMFNSQVALLTAQQAEAEKAAAAAAAAASDGDGDGGDDDAESNRDTTKLTFGEKEVSIQFSQIRPEGPDYERLATLQPGDIVRHTFDFATKLRTDPALAFGDTLVPTENVAADYPGVYSLWIEKAADGWALRFNQRPDIWGTQHNPEADGPAVPLNHETQETGTGTLRYTLEPNGETGATLRIEWGAHIWTTTFALAAGGA